MPASAEDVINDLLADFHGKLRELSDLRKMIVSLAERYGLDVTVAELPSEEAVVEGATPKIRPDQFFAMSQTDAAAALLQQNNRHPLTTDQILELLIQGGAQIGGSNPRQTLYTQLIRATQRFVKLPSGHFGLLDWYPEEKARRAGKGKGKIRFSKESGGAEDNDGEDTDEPEATPTDPKTK